MSFESDLKTLLLADGSLVAKVVDRVSSDRIEQGAGKPFVVFSRVSTEYAETLLGAALATKAVFEIQVRGDTRLAVEAVSDDIERVLLAGSRAVTGRSSGYDAELDLEATIITVEWWD
jgi:hypothetical protein